MELSPGTRLGPYEITGFIGSGAMGVVYKARDTRLGRDVAIKVLPAALLATAFNETSAMFSPDGQWIAYVSDESHDRQVAGRAAGDVAARVCLELGIRSGAETVRMNR